MNPKIISADWIIPVEPADTVLTNHSIVIEDTNIIGVLPTVEARRKFPLATETILDNHVLLPGLINLHTHSPMTLMRGMADDRALMTWLNDYIWPAESKYVSEAMVADGTALACAEMLRSGTTCFADMYFHHDVTARVTHQFGMRAALGGVIIDLPTAYASGPEAYIERCLAPRDEFANNPLLKLMLAPHAPYTVSDRTFERIMTIANEMDAMVMLHVHETQDEIRQSEADFGCRPITRLERLGVINANLIAAHCVHMTSTEIESFAHAGVHVAHCPTSNLKLASGIAPVKAMLNAGINVGIGTDGSASNNRLDMLAETRLASLLQKGVTGDATALAAHQALRMATLNAAKALGWENEIGSLVTGKVCDMIAIDLSAIETQPCYDPASHILHAVARENVTHTWVNGQLLMADRKLNNIDLEELKARARIWRERFSN